MSADSDFQIASFWSFVFMAFSGSGMKHKCIDDGEIAELNAVQTTEDHAVTKEAQIARRKCDIFRSISQGFGAAASNSRSAGREAVDESENASTSISYELWWTMDIYGH